MAQQMSLASIEDQLANAREQAIAQGMTIEQAEGHARSVVFGDDPEAGERYDQLKAGRAESLAQQDLQGEGQAITAADIAGVRESLGQAVAQQEDQVITSADIAGVRESLGQTAVTPQDYTDVQQGLRTTWEMAEQRKLEDERKRKEGAADYERRKQAVTDLMQRRVGEEQAASDFYDEKNRLMLEYGEPQEAARIISSGTDPEGYAVQVPGEQTASDEDFAAHVIGNYPSAQWPFEDQPGDLPGEATDSEAAIAARKADPKRTWAQERAVIDKQEAIAARDLRARKLKEIQDAAIQKAEEARRLAQDNELKAARRAEEQAQRYQKAALMMMMSAQQPIGPSTIGEAMSGKYGQRATQAQLDINTARTFFEQGGKIRREMMTKREKERVARRTAAKEDRIERMERMKEEGRKKRGAEREKNRLAVAKMRTDMSYLVARGRFDLMREKMDAQKDHLNDLLVLKWDEFGALDEMRLQKDGRDFLRGRERAAGENYERYRKARKDLAGELQTALRMVRGAKAMGRSDPTNAARAERIKRQMESLTRNMDNASLAMEKVQKALEKDLVEDDERRPSRKRRKLRKRRRNKSGSTPLTTD